MRSNNHITNIGEVQLIQIIEDLIFKETGEQLKRDDAFFYISQEMHNSIILNSDMFISSTDAPIEMSYFQMGRKAVVMNISDLVVKGVKPEGIIISLGLPMDLNISQFKDLIKGIIYYSKKWDLKYLGGDLNRAKELIINPTVFGLKDPEYITHREGLKVGDLLLINGKFGLTSVGFDILLNRKGNISTYPNYKRSINSVLEPDIIGKEGFFLSDKKLISSSIDSSDGLIKSLRDLMLSNRGMGFEIEFNENLIDQEAIKYANEFNLSLEKLILNGGEEFIHLFTIPSKNYMKALDLAKSEGGFLTKVGKVIPEEKVYFLKENKRISIEDSGYEHFK
jgi:thiamine-monophosphate kinase